MSGIDSLFKLYDYIRPILDVGLLAFLLYKAYQIIAKTNSAQILKAIIIVAMVYATVYLLNLTTVKSIFEFIAPALVVGLVIIFQPEIRKIFLKLGQTEWFFTRKKSQYTSESVRIVLSAAETLSKQKRGMLVVFLRNTNLDNIIDTGEILNAKAYKNMDASISASLLVTIFAFDTPLHDGACVIQNDKLIAAGCFLPLSEQYDIKKTFGTRHRAALGVSEMSDSVVLVVSEESGAISLAYDSKLHYDLTPSQLTNTLNTLLGVDAESKLEENVHETKAAS